MEVIKKRLIFISCLLLPFISMLGQCPERQSLYNRLIYLRDSSASVSPTEKLKELVRYESRMKGCSYRFDSTHALLLQRLGAAYFALGEFVSAVRYTQESITILQSNPGKRSFNYKYLLKNYSNLILFYDSLNNLKGKVMAFDSCIAIARRFQVADELYLIALTKKVEYLFHVGDYSLCLSYASIGEEATRRYDRFNKKQYLMFFNNWKLNILINDKKYDLAEKLLFSLLQDTLDNGSKDYLGTIYELLAQVMIHKGNSGRALQYFQTALRCDKRAGDELGCMQTLTNLGYSYYFKHLGNYKKALQSYKQALTIATSNGTSNQSEGWESLNILSNIAVIYVKTGLYDSALHYFQLAFNQIMPGFSELSLSDSLAEPFLNNRYVRYLAELVIDKGDAFLARYKSEKKPQYLTEAIKIYKLADHLLDRIKMNHLEIESKLVWQKNSRRLYENAIDACYQEKRAADAFYFFEKSRAVLLNDQLKEQNWVGRDDIFKLGQLKRKIVEEEGALRNTNEGDDYYAQLHNKILDDKQKLFELQQAIKIRNPLYYQHLIDTSFITILDVQKKLLKDHKALIEIFSGDSAVYVMNIKEKQVDFTMINKADFDSTANLYINHISSAALLNSRFTDFVGISNHLYRLIFKNDTMPAGRVIISPDGRYFPFEALVINPEGKNPSYYLSKYAVSYTYSSRYLLNRFSTTSQAGSKDFLGVAPLEYPNSWNMSTLHKSDLSLKRIQGYFRDSKVLLFKEASKVNFKSNFLNYKIIQLYTHASDSSSTGEPVIYFSDSTLYLSDLIGGEKPVTNLIVLSACNTGTGLVNTGEGVFSFNRGFAALGIPASITNLWAVDKESTLQLTELFYKYLDQKLPTDVALQRAKLEFLRATSAKGELPYYWAGTILAGKSDFVETKRPVSGRIILALIGLTLLVVIVIAAGPFKNIRSSRPAA